MDKTTSPRLKANRVGRILGVIKISEKNQNRVCQSGRTTSLVNLYLSSICQAPGPGSPRISGRMGISPPLRLITSRLSMRPILIITKPGCLILTRQKRNSAIKLLTKIIDAHVSGTWALVVGIKKTRICGRMAAMINHSSFSLTG